MSKYQFSLIEFLEDEFTEFWDTELSEPVRKDTDERVSTRKRTAESAFGQDNMKRIQTKKVKLEKSEKRVPKKMKSSGGKVDQSVTNPNIA